MFATAAQRRCSPATAGAVLVLLVLLVLLTVVSAACGGSTAGETTAEPAGTGSTPPVAETPTSTPQVSAPGTVAPEPVDPSGGGDGATGPDESSTPDELAFTSETDLDAAIAAVLDEYGVAGDVAVLVELEGRWLCEVQQVAVADLAEQDAMLTERLADAGSSKVDYDAFKAGLAASPDLRSAVLAVFEAACPAAVAIDGEDIPAD